MMAQAGEVEQSRGLQDHVNRACRKKEEKRSVHFFRNRESCLKIASFSQASRTSGIGIKWRVARCSVGGLICMVEWQRRSRVDQSILFRRSEGKRQRATNRQGRKEKATVSCSSEILAAMVEGRVRCSGRLGRGVG